MYNLLIEMNASKYRLKSKELKLIVKDLLKRGYKPGQVVRMINELNRT